MAFFAICILGFGISRPQPPPKVVNQIVAVEKPVEVPARQQQAGQNANAPAASPLSADAIFAQSAPAVVQVGIQDGQGRTVSEGSGFLVSAKGLIATNYHVVEKAHTAHVVLPDKSTLSVVGVAAWDEGADIAIIKVAAQISARPLELAGNDHPPVGTKVYAIGNPRGLASTLSDGLVSGYRDIPAYRGKGRFTMIQTSAPISPGSSGGPLLGPDGKVVGVMTISRVDGQNLNFAVPASDFGKLLLRCESNQLTRFPLPREAVAKHGGPGDQVPLPAAPRGDMADKVARIKAQLRYGPIKLVELEKMMGGPADKSEVFVLDAYIPEFKAKAGIAAVIRRYFPFEVPGVAEARYRVNLLFNDVEDGRGLQLTNWYFRSPN